MVRFAIRAVVVAAVAAGFLAAAGARAEVCEQCSHKALVAWPGKCIRCGQPTRYRESKLCRQCAEKAGQCEVCLAKIAEPKAPPGEGPGAGGPSAAAPAPAQRKPQTPAKPGRLETDCGLAFVPAKPHVTAATLVVMEDSDRAGKLLDMLQGPLEKAGLAAVLPRNADDMAAILADVESKSGFRAGRLVALGFSQNAAMAYKLALSARSRLTGLAVASAWAPKMEPAELAALAGLPVLVLHGQADRVCPMSEAARTAGLLRRAKAKVEMQAVPGAGHLQTVGEKAGALTDWVIARAEEADKPAVVAAAPPPTTQPAMVDRFLAAAEDFELKLDFVGKQPALEPYYGLHLSVPDWKARAHKDTLTARLTSEQATRIIRQLAGGGQESFFLRSVNVAGKTRMPDVGPTYTITASGPKDVVLLGYLGWGPRLMEQLSNLRSVTDGTPSVQLGRLIERLAPLKAEWDKELADQLRKRRMGGPKR